MIASILLLACSPTPGPEEARAYEDDLFAYKTLTAPLTTLCADGTDTVVAGDVYLLSVDSLTDLSLLDCVVQIDGTLTLQQLSALESLAGLENLTAVGGVVLASMLSLTDLTALGGLTSIDGHLGLVQLAALTDLSGLENITTVSGSLTINWTTLPDDLTLLHGIESVGVDVLVEKNTILTDEEAWSLVDAIGEQNIGRDISVHSNGP